MQQELQNHANALLVDLEEMRKHDGYEEETTIATHVLQFTFYVIFPYQKAQAYQFYLKTMSFFLRLLLKIFLIFFPSSIS